MGNAKPCIDLPACTVAAYKSSSEIFYNAYNDYFIAYESLLEALETLDRSLEEYHATVNEEEA